MPAALVDFAVRHGLEPSRLQAALDWQVNLWSGEMRDDERRAWAAWLSADAGNQQAWMEVERLAGRLGDLPTDFALQSLAQALPVAVHYRTPWLVRVAPLAKKNPVLG
jgi:transmembrane sensor